MTLSTANDLILTESTVNIHTIEDKSVTVTIPVISLNKTLPVTDMLGAGISTGNCTNPLNCKSSTNLGISPDTTNILIPVDTQALNETILFSHNFPSLGQTCTVNIPGIEISCADSDFQIQTSDIQGQNISSFNVTMSTDQFEGIDAAVSSNSISIDHIFIEQVSDINSGGVGGDDAFCNQFIFNSNLYLVAGKGTDCTAPTELKLYKVNTITSKLDQMTNNNSGSNDFPTDVKFIEYQGKMIITMLDTLGNVRIYRYTDSSLEIFPQINGADNIVTDFKIFGNKLYFITDHTVAVRKLYRLDNTSVEAIGSSSSDGTISSNDDASSTLINYNNSLFVDGALATGHSKLFKLISTSPNLEQVSDTRGSDNDPDFPGPINESIEFNSVLYLSANNSNGFSKLFKFNGTQFSEFSNTNSTLVANDDPANFTIYNGNLYFTATDDNTKYNLYKTDGTTIEKLHETPNALSSPKDFIIYKNELYFTSSVTVAADRKLYKTNGTTVTQVSNLQAGDDGIEQLYLFQNELYFVSTIGGYTLFKYNGNTIYKLTNTAAEPIKILLENNDELYFTGRDTAGKIKLFKITSSTP